MHLISSIKLSIVIPTYNRLDYLKKCLKSIEENANVSYEVIVVDGGSTDGTKEFLLAQPNNIKPIFDEKLEGCVRALNKGLRTVQGEYVCWLNDDMMVIENALTRMIDFLEDERHKKVGMGAFYYTVMDEGGKCSYDFIINSVAGIPYADCGMLKTSLMKELGYFDESFTKYSFDPDFSVRVWEKGLAVAGCKEAKLIHYQVWDETRSLFPSAGENSIGSKDGQVFWKKWENKLKDIRALIKDNFWSYLTEDQRCKFFFDEGVELERKKRFEEAEKLYIEALFFSEKIEILYRLGSMYQQQKRFKEAERMYLKILEVDDSRIEVLYNLGSMYQQSNETNKAIRIFNRVLHLETDRKDQYWAGACYHLGCIYKEKYDLSRAKKYFEDCLIWNPEHKAAMEEKSKIEKD